MTGRSESLTGADVGQEFARLAETLRGAAFMFETEKDGRFSGSILGCRAVMEFLYRMGCGAELAGPFAQIAVAFACLERGGTPALFAKKSTGRARARPRSPEIKHAQRLAAAALEVLVELKDERIIGANQVARHVSRWSGMAAQKITGTTVINWRNQQRGLSKKERQAFETVVKKILAEPDQRNAVERLLEHGPPGSWKS
jgi:hypothetical protein